MAGENAKVYKSQTPDTITVESGGTIDMRTGARITAAGAAIATLVDVVAPNGTSSLPNIADVGSAFNQTTLNGIIKSLATQLNTLQTACRAAGIGA